MGKSVEWGVPLRCAVVLLGLLCCLPLPAVAAEQTDGPEGTGSAVEAPVPQQVIIQTRRQVKEALLDAALTHREMSETFEALESFVLSYTSGLRMGDREIADFGLDRYLEIKVRPRLRQRGLTKAEQGRVEGLLLTWIDQELARDAGPALQRR